MDESNTPPVYLWTCYADIYIPLTRTRHTILLSGFGSDEEDFYSHIPIPPIASLVEVVPGTTEKVVPTPYYFEKKTSAHTSST